MADQLHTFQYGTQQPMFIVAHNSHDTTSGVATEGLGGTCSHFCQEGARDFLKIVEKIDGGGVVVANLQRSRGRGQKSLVYPSNFMALVMALDTTTSFHGISQFFHANAKHGDPKATTGSVDLLTLRSNISPYQE